jgi:LuxR family maltose regulon positive regulatory protein
MHSPPPRTHAVIRASSLADDATSGLVGMLANPTPVLSEPRLRLYLFGPLRAYVGGELVIDEHFTRRKAKELLVLLFLERGRYIPRDELLERLWPNLEEHHADSGRLKQTVLVLRRALEGQSSRRTGWRYIVEHEASYYFNTQMAYYCDLEDFQQELRLADLDRQHGDAVGALAHFERAFGVRRMALLPEFRYDDWAAPDVTAEREQYMQALEDAAGLHRARGEYGQAVELLKRATREDPLRESSALQLMVALWRKGDAAEALRVYSRLREILSSRLQLEPDPEITALYHAIRRDRTVGAKHDPGLSAVS